MYHSTLYSLSDSLPLEVKSIILCRVITTVQAVIGIRHDLRHCELSDRFRTDLPCFWCNNIGTLRTIGIEIGIGIIGPIISLLIRPSRR